MTTPTPGQLIELDGAANCRDLGGWPLNSGGTVRRGQVYRSTELHGLSDKGRSQLAALGLHTMYDLRTTAERDAHPDPSLTGVRDLHLDVLADDTSSAAAGAADLSSVLSDPSAIEAYLSGPDVTATFAQTYRDIVNLPSALAAYRAMYSDMATAEHRPCLFHCTTGKDRTGWGAAALLSFLGVSHDDVVAEYMLTNTEIIEYTHPMYDEFTAAGGNAELLRPVLGVEESYLHTAFEEMESRYGTIEGYFTKGLELDDGTLDALRDALTES